MSYSVAQGMVRGAVLELLDITYDGLEDPITGHLTGGLGQLFEGMPEGGWGRAAYREQADIVEEYLEILEPFERDIVGPELGPVGATSDRTQALREQLQSTSVRRRTVYDEGSSSGSERVRPPFRAGRAGPTDPARLYRPPWST